MPRRSPGSARAVSAEPLRSDGSRRRLISFAHPSEAVRQWLLYAAAGWETRGGTAWRKEYRANPPHYRRNGCRCPATELNRFVRKVTAWGTVGIAWTVITGIYGMNVVGIPGLDAPWGFAAVTGSMVLVAVVLAVFFRRHGWL